MDATTLLITVPAFLIALGVIVFVHELGHFVAAKLFGVRVLVFSLGFGKRLWGFDYRGTDCRVSAVPLGGYVQMCGELPEDRTGHADELPAKPRWQRILIYLAGPAMNVVLSVLLIAFLFMGGIPEQALQEIPSVIGAVGEGSPGERAGLAPGDRVVAVDGEPVDRWKDLAFAITIAPEKPLRLEVERQGERFATVLTPEKVERYELGEAGIYPQILPRISEVVRGAPADEAGFRPGDVLRSVDDQPITTSQDFVRYVEGHAGVPIAVMVLRGERLQRLEVVPADVGGKGRIGVVVGAYRKLPLGEALVASARYNVEIVAKSVELLGKLFTNEVAPKSALSGPIEIAAWSGRAARRGATDFLYMIGFLSISIGFMNLLPIPVLDGGHIFILLIESALRRDLSVVIKERVTQVGFMMLMMLMAMVIFFDLSKNLPALMPGS
ncbi:MAG: PDZ domain-containing protein [Acidobacteria bacterium]|nr:MAG: PDZ domain-containing protein [Acidobacteriota bacterium]